MSLHIASPKSAQVSMNNLNRAMPISGTRPVLQHNDGLMLKLLNRNGESIMQTKIEDFSEKQTKTEGFSAKQTTNHKGFTAEEIAQKLGISTSYVYAKLAKLEAAPLRKEGKTAFYSEKVIGKMQGRVRRQRRAIPEVVEEFQKVSKEHLGIGNSPQPAENLLDRMANLEKKLERFEAIEKSLEDIKRILGTL